MLVDRQVAAVGTANFDNRSFRLNFEITASASEFPIDSDRDNYTVSGSASYITAAVGAAYLPPAA